jgi:O-methyltransferase involved in polyketide biosynthesis
VDPRAVEAVNQLDYDFARVQRAIGDFGWVAWGYRAYRIDAICRDFFRRHPDGLVVNLGAGLDALFERIDNGRLDCYSVDLAPTIALRAALFPSAPRNHYLIGNLTDAAWLEDVPAHRPMIVVLSGVTMYLSTSTLERVFHTLHDAGRHRPVELVCDVFSPAAVVLTNWQIRRTGLPEARVDFGCWSARTFHRWIPGLRVLTDELLVRGLGSLGLIPAMGLSTRIQLLLCRLTRFARLTHLAFPPGHAS